MSRTGPCDWPLATECCSSWDALDAAVQERATQWATEILWMLTGRIYGICEVTVRPCTSRCTMRQSSTYSGFAGNVFTYKGMVGPWTPTLLNGAWVNCHCSGGDCGTICELELPFGPAAQIVSIQIDGETLPAFTPSDPLDPESESVETYRIDSYDRLVRLDGQCWPESQDLSKSLDNEGTWGITYRWGIPVPSGGQIAAAELACEFAKACNGDSKCKLPSRVQTISRQGVSMTLLDTLSDLWISGRTGLYNVDLWLQAINPYGLRERPVVMSPEILRQRQVARRRTTWSPPPPEVTP